MRFQKVATGTINNQETNFRILAGKVDDLVFNTRCKTRNSNKVSGSNKPINFPTNSKY